MSGKIQRLNAIAGPNMNTPLDGLMLQFLRWVCEGKRTRADAMAAWRSTCPRMSVWEDALADGLIELGEAGSPATEMLVRLTPRGNAFIRDAERA